MELLKIKIPVKAASVLITKLRKRGNYVTTGKAYATNKASKVFGFYFGLKAMTTTGLIENYPSQLFNIERYTFIKSNATFLDRLKKAQRFGLIKKTGKNNKDLQLCSWVKCLSILGIEQNKQSIKFINFDFENNIPVPIQYLVELAEETENQHFTKAATVKKISQNKELVKVLKSKLQANQHPADLLFDMQIDSFINDDLTKTDYNMLHSVQSCPFRSVQAMINSRTNGRSIKATFERIAYFKRKINIPELAQVVEQSCTTNGVARPNTKFYYNGFCQVKFKPKWYLPDMLKPLAYVA